jgi:hypothetical protein
MRWLVIAVLLAGACKPKDEKKAAPPAAPAAPAEEPGKSIHAALAAYEKARSRLAADETAGVADDAAAIEAAVKTAQPKATPAQAPHLGALAAAAAALRTTATEKKDDVEAVRHAFGEVSRHVIALLGADAALATGRHVFKCGMYEGYDKWVQLDEKVANPYQGKKMLGCGSASTWD